jgi:predicted short-subunit dehydrogenase-like oxidoreductase (DUF2520 family)
LSADRLWIVGAGRLGLALGLALHRSGAVASLAYSGRRASAPEHPLFAGDPAFASYDSSLAVPRETPTGILLAVPDSAIGEVAAAVAALNLPPEIPVLHASGALSADVLAALAARGHPVGGVHALAAVADPVAGADRLRGATFGVEGEGEARALAERIVRGCGGLALAVPSAGKPLYHAAAVFAANYAVVLLGVAERLMREAGVPPEDARAALAGLAAGAVENVAERGPAAALTGPVARGDAETVRLHLARLSGADRPLYSLLAREALGLARDAGLAPDAAARVEEEVRECGSAGVRK